MLTERQMKSLKLMAQTGDYTLREYAKRFGVSDDRILVAFEELGIDFRAGKKMIRTLPSGKTATVLR